MDIFPQLMSEKEFSLFTASTYMALKDVLDDLLADDLRAYMTNPDADPMIVESIQRFLGPTIESLTFHIVLKERGILEKLQYLLPQSILTIPAEDVEPHIKDLLFLEENSSKLMSTIPKRSKEAWDNFYAEMTKVVDIAESSGTQLSYPDLLANLQTNKFIFYQSNSKGHSTNSYMVNSRRREWTMCLKGLQFKTYCDDKNIPIINRRVF